MSYVEPERVGEIVLDEPPFEGAEVKVRENVGVGIILELQRLINTPPDTNTDNKMAAYHRLCELFGTEVLRGWNVEGPNGEQRPANKDGCAMVDPAFLGSIVGYYVMGMRHSPLSSGSAGGAPSPKATRTPRRAKSATPRRAK